MAYTKFNYKTIKALREAVKLCDVPVFQPGPFGPDVKDGKTSIEGPHYPEPHKWYAQVSIRGGVIPKGSRVI